MKKLMAFTFLILLGLVQNSAFAGGSDGAGGVDGGEMRSTLIDVLDVKQDAPASNSVASLILLFCSRGGEKQYPNIARQLNEMGCGCESIAADGGVKCEYNIKKMYP